jgi:4-hydroxybenzoate polyprenyltransferase
LTSVWHKTRVFLEMIKFEHSIFALPFAYLGLILGENGWPRLDIFIWVTVAMVSFRTMGMAINRLVDLPIDALNPRTKNRALPAGKIKSSFVGAAVILSFVIFEATTYRLGPACFRLSPVPVFLAILYPYLKRFTWFSHLVLGMILAIAPYGAWLASRGTFSWVPGFISIGVMTWVCGFDMIYALQDVDFDKKYGLYSFPSRFSTESTFRLTKILHVITVLSWLEAGRLAGLGLVYGTGMIMVTAFLIREHWLIHSSGLAKIDEAFFTMNAVVSVAVFLAVVLDLSFGRMFS